MCDTTRLMIGAGAALFAATLGLDDNAVAQTDADLIARARAIHERVITLDTHDDIEAAHFTAGCNYTMRLTTQVTLPKMKEGGLDVAFFVVYVAQQQPPQSADAFQPAGYERAYRAAIEKFDAIDRLTKQIAPKEIELALAPADVVRIAKSGKKVAVIGIENAYPIGTDLKKVQEFWQRGGRYMSLAHNGHNQFADSHTGEAGNQWAFGGLSPLGRQAIGEMNRWGIMVDVSHLSKASALQSMALSRAPVIASHSAVRSVRNHSRNLDDETLAALKTNGGVIQIVALGGFVKSEPPERGTELTALLKEFGLRAGSPSGCPLEPPGGRAIAGVQGTDALTAERRAEFDRRMADVNRKWPRASVKDVIDHIDYAVKRIGIDHVGISSDFDGGGGVEGWDDASETFNVTLELVRRGYSEQDIARLWSGNLLRVWSEVEKVAVRPPSP